MRIVANMAQQFFFIARWPPQKIGGHSVLFVKVKRGMADDGNPPDGPQTAKQKIGESSVLF